MNSTTDHIPLEDGHVCSDCINELQAPTERDIDVLLENYAHKNYSLEFSNGEREYARCEKELLEAKQAIEAHYKAKFEKWIGEAKPPATLYDDGSLGTQYARGYNKAVKDFETDLLNSIRNDFRANLREKL